ncbi:MAG: AsnC family transcriptional regulator [Bacteroidetes bacterium]|jgi:Lrp/AsnC family transcriptional regulator for asnA, asnC and gidA|nr:AsnC family transcriptional regulator [Bacteroidota bacterium]
MAHDTLLDELDRKILSILSRNARKPFLEVARECGVSGAAIHQRVQRLTKSGVIKGSEFTFDPKKLGFQTLAYIGIYLENSVMFNKVVQQLKNIMEITECHYTTGQYAVFVKVYAQNNEHLKNIIADKIQSIEGVSRTETFISLEELFHHHIPVSE